VKDLQKGGRAIRKSPKYLGEVDVKPTRITSGETKKSDFGHPLFDLGNRPVGSAAKALSFD
jgi:hypothetical protein